MDSQPASRMGGREPFQAYSESERRQAPIPNTDLDDPLSRYIGRPANPETYQRQHEQRPNPKTPLFEEFESLRQEMLVDSRNTRTNKWREDTRSRGNTREIEERVRNRVEVSGNMKPRQPSKERNNYRTGVREPAATGSDLLEQLIFSEFAAEQNKIGQELPKPPVSIHEVRDQLAFLNRVGLN